MVRFIPSFLAALALVPLAGAVVADTQSPPQTIVWEKTLDDSLAKAKASGKPILLDFFVPT